jgi:hypothetical protein
MFKHALDSFEHGLEHFLDGSERSRKFAILHIDQAVELILKERCIKEGKSIYKTDGTTLSLHESFNSLKGSVDVPERPRLEELHDLRNTIQHKGLLPDEATTSYHIDVAYFFIKRFLSEELDTQIEEVISSKHRAMMEGPEPLEAPEDIVAALKSAAEASDPLTAIISAYTVLERAAKTLAEPGSEKIRLRKTLKDAALVRGSDPKRISKRLDAAFMLRGQVLHSEHIPTPKDSESMLKVVNLILEDIGIKTK